MKNKIDKIFGDRDDSILYLTMKQLTIFTTGYLVGKIISFSIRIIPNDIIKISLFIITLIGVFIYYIYCKNSDDIKLFYPIIFGLIIGSIIGLCLVEI